MAVAILISGSINAGKTAAAREISRRLPQTAHIEVDSLRDFIRWMPLEESISLNLENAAAVGRNFLARGLNVVLTYPLRSEEVRFLERQFEPFPVHCVTLAPRLEVALGARGSRVPDSEERARIAQQYENGIAAPTFGDVIDNSDLSEEETARRILHNLRAE